MQEVIPGGGQAAPCVCEEALSPVGGSASVVEWAGNQDLLGSPVGVEPSIDGGASTSGSFPVTGTSGGINTHVPFTGELRAATWNTQALLAANTHRHFQKRNRARARILKNDFVCFQEAHAQEGRTLALQLPENHCAVWANGTTRQGGIGIVLKHSLLRMFDSVDPLSDFEIVEGGRVAILHLRGPYGDLDICCSYLDANFSSERSRTIRKLAAKVRPRSSTLTVLAGDFNFVTDRKDRWSTQAERWAENRDSKDTEVLDDCLLQPFGLHEWEQTHFTCDPKGARARLDRMYVNQHISVQLDHNSRAYFEKWCPDLSTHRPVGIARVKGGGKALSEKPMLIECRWISGKDCTSVLPRTTPSPGSFC